MKNFLRTLRHFYLSANRVWVPLLAGALYSIALPPFNHEFNPIFFLFPLLVFAVLVPLAAIASQPSFKRAFFHTFLYGFTASLGQYYWLAYDKVEGLWLTVLVGLILISAFMGLIYLTAGMLFRLTAARLPRAYIVVYPAIWVAIDYCRTLGDIAFPWAFLGYSLTPILPLAQMASFTGVWGLTYAIVLGNMLFWELLKKTYSGQTAKPVLRTIAAFVALLAIITIAGWIRIGHCDRVAENGTPYKITVLQTNIDQFHWGYGSIDSVFTLTETMVRNAADGRPDLLIMPESSLLCYVSHRMVYSARVTSWSRLLGAPMIFGSLDFEKPPSGSYYDNFVYNTAFILDSAGFKPYHKIWLVPFSEGMPFESKFPILSRVNLGEADFQRGKDPAVFSVGHSVYAAPFICYESNFPRFVLERFRRGANLIVNITNDGWFGKSTGPFHHAMMARMRAIENGVYLARAANSGISMFVDPVGRVLAHSGLYTRETLTRTLKFYSVKTFYTRFGDWFVAVCGILILIGLVAGVAGRKNKR